MKLNISYPATGANKLVEVDDAQKLQVFMDKRISAEVPADSLGDEWKGYIFRINGGNDLQGFPMKQGVMLPTRVRLLMGDGHSCYRPRRSGERRRKSVRGCIVSPDLSVLHLSIVRKGEDDYPGLTDTIVPRRLGPKRANKIRKLFQLSKEDDVRKYLIRREVTLKNGKTASKAPKIQRLVTCKERSRTRHLRNIKKERFAKSKHEKARYAELVAQRLKERRDVALLAKKARP